jgi:hypothetical protein
MKENSPRKLSVHSLLTVDENDRLTASKSDTRKKSLARDASFKKCFPEIDEECIEGVNFIFLSLKNLIALFLRLT